MAQLRLHQDELSRLRTRVLLVAFGAEAWARAWLRDNAVGFPLLLDPDRRLYQVYGLERSVLRTWSPRMIWFYTRRVATGYRLHPVRGDPYQLGGDVIVDATGIIRLLHRCRDPVDRPPVERLLEVLRGVRADRR